MQKTGLQATEQAGFAATLAALFPLADKAAREKGTLSPASARRKLWEISPCYHCVVIGTCLSMRELRAIARRAGLENWDSDSDYELHHAAVNATCQRNALSRLIHKELARNFEAAVKRFAQARTDEAIRAQWKDALSRGEVAGALWAVMTHPIASEKTLELASQDLHMLSHQAGASSRADLRCLAELERENAALREQLKSHCTKSAEQLAAKDALIAALERRVADAAGQELRLSELEKRLRELEDEGALAHARRALAAESARAQRAQEQLERLLDTETRCLQLEQALAEARAESQAAERALQAALETLSGNEAAVPATCAADLSGRSVLYVGGRTGLVDHYRLLVEQCGGRFLHHDGGLENSLKRLQPLLASTDAVVCASGNVSHSAYYAVKRFCKQASKPCVLLRNASLSSFVNGLRALGGAPFHADAGDTVLVPAS